MPANYITQIVVPGRSLNTALPTLASLDYDTIIGQDANLVDWFTPKPAYLTLVDTADDPDALVDEISVFASRKVGSAAALNRGGFPKQAPHYIAEFAPFNYRGAIRNEVSSGQVDDLLYSAAFPVAGDWSKVALAYIPALPSGTMFALSTVNTGNRHTFGFNNLGRVVHRVGASTSEALIFANYAVATPFAAIATWDATAHKAMLSLDLGITWAAPSPAGANVNLGAAPDITAITTGNLLDGYLGDQMIWSCDLSKAENAAKLKNVRNYFRDMVQLP